MIEEIEGREFNILSSTIKVRREDEQSSSAYDAIMCLQDEIDNILSKNPKLKNIDVAVLAALNFASKNVELEQKYKANLTELRSGVESALEFVQKVSPDPIIKQ